MFDLIRHTNACTKSSERRPTQGVVRLQVPVGQIEEALDPFQRHFGLQDTVEHPGEGVEWEDQHSHQSQRGEHLRGGGFCRQLKAFLLSYLSV